MKNFDKDKFIKRLLLISTILLALVVVVISVLMITDVLKYSIGNSINVWLIFVIACVNGYVQFLQQKKFNSFMKFYVVLVVVLLLFAIAVTIVSAIC